MTGDHYILINLALFPPPVIFVVQILNTALVQEVIQVWYWNLNLIAGVAQENGSISEDVIRNAVSATEDGFLTLVRRSYGIKPLIAAMGSCCLVGVIWKGTLYIANLGDSRAVIGSIGRSNKIVAEQLTKEHNASKEEVRRELKSLHPEDSQIVVMKQGTWRIKGIIQVFFSFLFRNQFLLMVYVVGAFVVLFSFLFLCCILPLFLARCHSASIT